MQLGPCPTCGSEELAIEEGPEGWAVECDDCSTRGPTAPTEARAYEAWNNHAKPHLP
jgi:restriction alleviation protein Lar